MVPACYVGMLLYFPFFFFFPWLCFCSDSFINWLPKELLNSMLQWLSQLRAFFWSPLISQVVKLGLNQFFLLIYLTLSLLLTMKNVPGGRDTGNEGRERKLNYGVSSRNPAFCWRKLISLLLKCNYEMTRHQLTGRTEKERVFLPPIGEKRKGLM